MNAVSEIAVGTRSQTPENRTEIEPIRDAIADIRNIAIGGRMSVQLTYHRTPNLISSLDSEPVKLARADKLRGEPERIAHSLTRPAILSHIRLFRGVK
ncbi:MAG: hypothetical protein SW833_09935 [Cyanobacteriota bacterium]|nr:hypothetical protein [Cyanobacteriota bacterium]